MRLIKIESVNGAHCYQSINVLSKIPQGWAVIPDDMETPYLPYGEVETAEINGIMTVTKWIPGELPEEPALEEDDNPTVDELLDILLGVSEDE